MNKFHVVVLSFLLQSITAQEKKVDEFFKGRIVGGSPASPGEFPFMVSWHYSLTRYPDCGGSLVAPNLVLTAAHCGSIPGGVRVGSISARGLYNGMGAEASVIRKIRHPQYNDLTVANDFMLLQLDRDIDTSIYKPVNLNFNSNLPSTSEMLTVAGFGTLSTDGNQPNYLRKVNVPVVSYQTCSNQYSDLNNNLHLCAGYQQGKKDSCQGDSGGPLFKKINGEFTQFGVVSYGYGCALPDYSGVYARISGVETWMKKEICNRSSNPRPSYCAGRATSPPQPLPTPSPTIPCVNTPPNWHDKDGTTYNCDWYGQEENCVNYGNLYVNYGKTANQACCDCGGGNRQEVSSTRQPTLQPTRPPTPRPVAGVLTTSSPTRSSITPAPTIKQTPVPTKLPTASPINPTTVAPTGCSICDDNQAVWMNTENILCDSPLLDLTDCCAKPYWLENKVCEDSCYHAGVGYPGYYCCDAAATNSPTTVTPMPSTFALDPSIFSNIFSGIYDNSNCITCDDNEIEWMANQNLDCVNSPFLQKKCNKNNNWRQNKYCQYSCYMEGNGYYGDKCCTPTNEPTPPPSQVVMAEPQFTSAAPSKDQTNCNACTNIEIDYMFDVGMECDTSFNYVRSKCKKSSNWRLNKYCQKTCYELECGYDGDKCCA